ncbi:unnamed protein product [marine sediment metagenome]|uniref:Uncharacterized protein n=1 Tax=marine sediment metagenome TaxID=412755 RepID=X1G7K7_9ZZZZ
MKERKLIVKLLASIDSNIKKLLEISLKADRDIGDMRELLKQFRERLKD